MSIGGIMRTSVSGMNAQANRLSAVSENIANANTTGYKRNTTEFSSMVLSSGPGQFNSGVVESQSRQLISQQGGLSYTTNSSSSQAIDLAIQGRGFMVVGDNDGGTFLTRAGSFVKNGNGDMVNAAGFILQGYPLPIGDTNGVANGFAGLENVNLNAATLRLKPTDNGLLTVNLNKGAEVNSGAQPPLLPGSVTSKESMVVYDSTGKAITLDIYMTKTAAGTPPTDPLDPSTGTPDQWTFTIFNRDDAGTGPDAPFPYTGAPVLAPTVVDFDASGQMVTSGPFDGSFVFTIPGGEEMRLSLDGTTQLDGPFQTLAASVNGNPPEAIDQIKVGEDGIISAVFKSGTEIPLYKVPLALVESPDNMTARSGNVYSAGVESGTVLVGFGGESGLGTLVAGALEQSTVDLASELTTMIESQRSYTANSKVFQTGSEILDVLVNLKR